ncbi:MAG: DUF1538 domain-containing protein [Clostridia bacterium]|nr:DUF1538 domain-containing protein [Clostridia bacterium]
MSWGMLGLFLGGALLLIVGMAFFTLGADMSMMPMGEELGSTLARSRKLWLLILAAFVLGVFITIAEPDLQVLAQQVPGIPNMTLILAVALGVGIFLVAALLRIVFQKRLSLMLVGLYAVVICCAIFAPDDYLAVAFDSGGVTTGPVTVPFILALGLGVAAVRSGREAREDSFGLVALSSIGPILAVLLLTTFYNTANTYEVTEPAVHVSGFLEIVEAFGEEIPTYMGSVGIALLPIVAVFFIFQIFLLKLSRRAIIRMCVGLVYTYVGLTLFLTGVEVGFMPAGYYLGHSIGAAELSWMLIPLGALMGFFVVMAEPAVHVLNKEVEDITLGSISRNAMLFSLAIGVACSLALSMIRVIYGFSVWWLILPGYGLALLLMLFAPPVFTAVAFDSGGVASGPMTATFLLPFAEGACQALGGNVLTDAFGVVAMVALTPLITIQLLGLSYKRKLGKDEEDITQAAIQEAVEDDIIELEDE